MKVAVCPEGPLFSREQPLGPEETGSHILSPAAADPADPADPGALFLQVQCGLQGLGCSFLGFLLLLVVCFHLC